MRHIFSLVFLLSVTLSATSQQINPVPDYIFRNSMSVGRNAPTDTSAYFSIGPRFGATRGFMPPMVVDTAAVTGTKRNGLLIYSIQRNSFLYWDSTGNRWSRIAANLDTLQLSTRLWRQKGIDSLAAIRIAGSGTTNRVAKFTASGTIGDGSIADNSSSQRMAIFSSGRIGVNTNSDNGFQFDVSGSLRNTTDAAFATSSGNVGIGTATPNWKLNIVSPQGAYSIISQMGSDYLAFGSNGESAGTTNIESSGALKINTNAGSTRIMIESGGNVGVGTTSPSEALDVNGRIRARTIDSVSSPINVLTSDVNGVIRKAALAGVSDTLSLSTRAWRQKGIDSLASVRIGGSGISGYIPKFTAARTLDSSQIQQVGAAIGIGATPTSFKLTVGGGIRTTGGANIGSTTIITGDTIGGAILLNNPQVTPNTATSMGIFAVGNGQTTSGANNSEIFVHVAGPGSSASDGPFYAMRGNNFSRFSNARGAMEFRAGQISSPVGNDGAVLVTSPSSFINMRTGLNFDSRLYIANNGLVGIGTTQPTLVTSGRNSLVLRGTTSSELLLQSSSATDGTVNGVAIAAGGNDMGFTNRLGGFFNFNTNSVDVFRIHGNGRVTVNTTTDAGYQFDVAGSMRNTTDAYFATSSGRVGIGNTSPDGVLRVTSSVLSKSWVSDTARDVIIAENGSGSSGVDIRANSSNSSFIHFSDGSARSVGNIEYRHSIDGMLFQTNSQERIRIESDGDVGIGTSSPVARLHVDASTNDMVYYRNTTTSGAANVGVNLAFGGHNGSGFQDFGYIQSLKENSTSGNNNTFMSFWTRRAGSAIAERMRIASDGEVLINTTSDAGAFQLQVNGVTYSADGLRTGAPAGGTAATWKLGTVATVSPTSPNRTIEVDIGGTIYYIHAKTTND